MLTLSRSGKTLISSGLGLLIIVTGACTGKTPATSTTPYDPGSPLVEFSTSHFAGSGNCAQCHSNLSDANGNDVSIDTHWRSTIMANAAKDPYFLAKVASEVTDLPELAEVIEDTCATCHMPMARTQAVSDGTSTNMLGNGFLSTPNSLNAAAMDGNSCTLCHQIQDEGLGTEDSFEGHYVIDTSTLAPDRLIFGQYSDLITEAMKNEVGFTPIQGTQMNASEMCATCHTVYTPFIDGAGNVGGMFPEQTPYLEWEQSSYGSNENAQIECQSCHMPMASSSVAISNNPYDLAARNNFYQHMFVGGSSMILDIMASHVEELGLTASSEQMLATSQLTSNQLETRTGQVSIVNSSFDNGEISVTLAVSDRAGHKFPTGFPSRRAWIQFTVTDSNGKVVFESGAPNADGSIKGNDGDAKAGTYEPHYDVITDAGQVQIYESVMRDTDGNVTYNLLRGSSYLKDNRLLPTGFDKVTASADTGVYGEALTDANFTGGSDQVTYKISLKGSGPYTVTARLLYQTVSYQFSKAFVGNDSLVQTFLSYYQSADKTPELIYSISKTIE